MRLIRLNEVINISGLSRATVYRFMDEGRFPKSVSLGDRAVAWVYEEVCEWINEKIKMRG